MTVMEGIGDLGTVSALMAGISLSAAAGLRVFLPVLALGLASRLGLLELGEDFAWLASDPVLLVVGIAALLEASAYYIPVVDNLLDTLATPAAIGGGTVIVASLLILGYLVMSGRALALAPAMTLFALAGLFHGAAFGGAMATAEAGAATTVLVGYLIGLGVVQYALAAGVAWFTRSVWKASDATAIQPRLAGAVVAGVGLVLALEAIEGAMFAAFGIA